MTSAWSGRDILAGLNITANLIRTDDSVRPLGKHIGGGPLNPSKKIRFEGRTKASGFP